MALPSMFHTEFLMLALLALLVEAAVGYPDAVFRAFGHPVTWVGSLIAALDRHLNRPSFGFAVRRVAGVVGLIIVLAVTFFFAKGLTAVLSLTGWFGAVIALPLAASTLLAQRSLHLHVARVRDGIRDGGLEAGRQAVSKIVGRNPQALDEAGVCRAAIESLAENFSDGVTAPVFWTAAGGLAGGALYKAINTADSMIGHKSEKHRAFGWAAARLDDLVNLPASRLSGLLIIGAAALSSGCSARDAIAAVRRDARHHRSPNAGWPEAAMAGALGLKLNGPRVYGDVLVEDGYMGHGRREADDEDIDRALRLYRRSLALLMLVVAFGLGLAVSLGKG